MDSFMAKIIAPENPRIQWGAEQIKNIIPRSHTVTLEIKKGIGEEGFSISKEKKQITITGHDPSGVMYGCLELCDRLKNGTEIEVTDSPDLSLRGACIGMQKLTGKYLWSYTPKDFPFFYDKEFWNRYLDFLAFNRFNTLYLWNGHPFSSLLSLEGYPQEISEEDLSQNRKMYRWLMEECDRRGIWLVQMFYNIHLPKKLAETYNLSQDLSVSDPIAADYTQQALKTFSRDFPGVGLLVCLGEALKGKRSQLEWWTETILPSIPKELPIIIRGHSLIDTDNHVNILKEGRKRHDNLFSMAKFNGESLTTYEPRGKYQQSHKEMAAISKGHIANVHLLSNLEPFRYGAVDWIQRSVKAIHDRLDGKGLHLYPLAYWDWPNAPDTTEISQIDRDWIWFEAWGRYAWKIDRDLVEDKRHWIGRLAEKYGSYNAAEDILDAYIFSGEIAPRLIRRFGITGGNRQCLSLGMTLDQLVNPKKYHPWKELYESDAPEGELIAEYVQRQEHHGETPETVIQEVENFSSWAIDSIEAAEGFVSANQDEFQRLKNDIYCIRALSEFYCAKVQAAICDLRGEKQDAVKHLKKSLEAFWRLASLAGPAYRYANGYHGRQLIPWKDVYHWSQVVEKYRKELQEYIDNNL